MSVGSLVLIVALVFWVVKNRDVLASIWAGLDWPTRIVAIGVVTAWWIYRLGQSSQRAGVIQALRKELGMHSNWFATEHPNEVVPNGQGWERLTYGIYRLSTVAVDNAITQGPGLFLSQELTTLLVGYRQMVHHFNQLNETASSLQIEVASGRPSEYLIQRFLTQTQKVHWLGIGDRFSHSAHYYFYETVQELMVETRAPFSWCVWFVAGLRIYAVERFVYIRWWRANVQLRNWASKRWAVASAPSITRNAGAGRCQRCSAESNALATIMLSAARPRLWLCGECADALQAQITLFDEVVKSLEAR
jgi:hypothetical protein